MNTFEKFTAANLLVQNMYRGNLSKQITWALEYFCFLIISPWQWSKGTVATRILECHVSTFSSYSKYWRSEDFFNKRYVRLMKCELMRSASRCPKFSQEKHLTTQEPQKRHFRRFPPNWSESFTTKAPIESHTSESISDPKGLKDAGHVVTISHKNLRRICQGSFFKESEDVVCKHWGLGWTKKNKKEERNTGRRLWSSFHARSTTCSV